MEKIVSQLDVDGFLVGPVVADESPLEPGVFLIPGGAIDQALPDPFDPGKCYKPDDAGGWIAFEDNRRLTLFLTSTGEKYPFGEAVEGEVYNGRGSVPAWLTALPKPDSWSIWDGTAWKRDQAAYDSAVRAAAAQEKAARTAVASQIIATLQDAVDLGLSTPQEELSLREWKTYRVLLSRVDVTAAPVQWPVAPGNEGAGSP